MRPRAQLLSACLLGALACVLYFTLRPAGDEASENAFFYDLEEHQLFVAPRKSIPPIPGVKGSPAAGVRAVVISTSGDPTDSKHRQIAYLEKYSPELKALLEEMQKARAEGRPAAGRLDRGQAPANTWVKAPDDPEWHALNSAEGERITGALNLPGPDGKPPLVCSP